MLLVRAFSATSRRAQQPPFEEYVRPLNEKAKKNIRKKALRRAPKFHGRMKKDTAFLLKAFERLQEEREQDGQILARLQGLIKKHAGPRFDVVDISMHQWAVALHGAPLDFAIVDREYPNGLPPGAPTGSLPVAYDPSTLSKILTSEGYTGSFWSPPPNGMQQKLPSLPRDKNPTPGHQELSSPWPEYCPSPHPQCSNHLVHPARLIANSPIAFNLTLPGPTIIPLSRYLRANFSLGSAGRDLLGVFWLWMQSLGINPLEVGPTCLGLIIVVFMQQKYHFPNITDSKRTLQENPAPDITSKVWVPYRHLALPFGEAPDLGNDIDHGQTRNSKQPGRPGIPEQASPKSVFEVVPVQLNVSFVEQLPRLVEDRSVSGMLHSFLDYLATSDSWYRGFIIAPGKGGRIPRHQPTVANLHQYVAFEESERKSESLGWAGDVLVVQDPFLSTYNHAEGLSKSTHRYLYLHCRTARKVLGRGHPLVTIFGKELRGPNSKLFDNQSSISMLAGQRAYKAYHSDSTRAEMDINTVPAPVLAARSVTIRRVREAVRQVYGVKYDVQAFGSTQYGVSTAASDLDLVIIDPDRPIGFTPNVNLQRLPPVYDVRKLGKTMRQYGFIRIVTIPKAKVPIVKFVDPTTRLECDINVNDQLGLINTSMIKRYCDLVPVLRPMLGYIKRWAKPLGLNSPSIGKGPPTFSTYAFALMVIGYLQLRGWAPNLQHGIENSSGDSEDGVFWIRESSVPRYARRICCDTRYHRKADWKPDIEVELREALYGWFAFWSEGFDHESSMIDIKAGGVMPRPAKHPEMLASEGSQQPTETVLPLKSDLSGVAGDDLSEHDSTDLADISSEKEEGEAVEVLNEREEEDDEEDRDNMNLEVEENAISTFANENICVIDPFVRTKNVTRNINKKTLELFRSNCQRVAILMSCDASINEVIDLEDDPVFQPQSFTKKKNYTRPPLYPKAETPDRGPGAPPQSVTDEQPFQETVTTGRSRIFNELILPLLPVDGNKSSTTDKGKGREKAPSSDHSSNISAAPSQPSPRVQPTVGSSSHPDIAGRFNSNRETRKKAWTGHRVGTEEGKGRGPANNVDLATVKKVMLKETPTIVDARKDQPVEVPGSLEMFSGGQDVPGAQADSSSLPQKKSKNRRKKRGKGQREIKKSAEEAAPESGQLGSKDSITRFDKGIHTPQEHSVRADDQERSSSARQLRINKDIKGQERQSSQRPPGKGKGGVGEGSSRAPGEKS